MLLVSVLCTPHACARPAQADEAAYVISEVGPIESLPHLVIHASGSRVTICPRGVDQGQHALTESHSHQPL